MGQNPKIITPDGYMEDASGRRIGKLDPVSVLIRLSSQIDQPNPKIPPSSVQILADRMIAIPSFMQRLELYTLFTTVLERIAEEDWNRLCEGVSRAGVEAEAAGKDPIVEGAEYLRGYLDDELLLTQSLWQAMYSQIEHQVRLNIAKEEAAAKEKEPVAEDEAEPEAAGEPEP